MQNTENKNSINVQFSTGSVLLENSVFNVKLNCESIYLLDLLAHNPNSNYLKEIERFMAEVFQSETIRLESHRTALSVLQYFKQLLIEIQQNE